MMLKINTVFASEANILDTISTMSDINEIEGKASVLQLVFGSLIFRYLILITIVTLIIIGIRKFIKYFKNLEEDSKWKGTLIKKRK